MGTEDIAVTMSGAVCELAHEAERSSSLYGGKTRKKSPEWCGEWLCRIGSYAAHRSLMSRGTHSLEWLADEHGVSRLDIYRIEHPDVESDSCIEFATIEELAEAFGIGDAQAFMNEALEFIPIDTALNMEQIRELEREYDAGRERIEALLKEL